MATLDQLIDLPTEFWTCATFSANSPPEPVWKKHAVEKG